MFSLKLYNLKFRILFRYGKIINSLNAFGSSWLKAVKLWDWKRLFKLLEKSGQITQHFPWLSPLKHMPTVRFQTKFDFTASWMISCAPTTCRSLSLKFARTQEIRQLWHTTLLTNICIKWQLTNHASCECSHECVFSLSSA